MTIEEMLEQVRQLQERERKAPTDEEQTKALIHQVLKNTRGGSRFAGENASPEVLDHLAAGGAVGQGGQLVPAGAPVGTSAKVAGDSLAGTMVKALAEATGSAGGFLVPVQIAAEVVTIIRARSAVMLMGPTVVPVEKELDVTSFSLGASASYVPENALATVSEPTFVQAALLKPKELVGMIPASNRLLRDAARNPNLDQALRADLAEVLSLRADLAFLQGPGTGAEPLGIRGIPGKTAAPSLGANGATPTFDNLKDMVANLRGVNAPFQRPGWIFHPRLLSTLEKLKDNEGRYLADAGLLTFDRQGGGGTLLNFPFRTTGQIPTNLTVGTSNDASYIVFSSDWQECWVGEEEQLTIQASDTATYSTDGGTTWQSAWQQRQTLFRAIWVNDIALRRPQLFSVMEGVRP